MTVWYAGRNEMCIKLVYLQRLRKIKRGRINRKWDERVGYKRKAEKGMEERRTKRGMTEGYNLPVLIFPAIHVFSEQQRVDPFRNLDIGGWLSICRSGLRYRLKVRCRRIRTIPLTVFLRNRCSKTLYLCEVTLKVFDSKGRFTNSMPRPCRSPAMPCR